ncbi:ankyrin repeat domain-containing protein [Fusarium mexicanum]|uniref:Ankyrin repeat domain-containing protein n=1 Tax=Fusarium mexicanum TaxID=751941 RepID=A0A8H5I2I8_9HYPO|nr:ankyrin repeat domain-containing protein [Fusarium mexicanum]
MDVTGLVIGVAGLAGLFTSCLEAVNIVQTYQTFRTDSRTLNTRFKVAKTLFEQWGSTRGNRARQIATSSPFRPRRREYVQKGIKDIQQILARIEGENRGKVSSLLPKLKLTSSEPRYGASSTSGLTVLQMNGTATPSRKDCLAGVRIIESEDLLLEDLPDAVDDHYVNTGIVGLCGPRGPLVEVRNGPSNPSAGQCTVHLPHFSVKQYLLYHLPMPGWILYNDHLQTSHERFQNTVLAKACPPQYAATAWHQHVTSGLHSDPVILRLCMGFLNKDNSTWDSWRTLIDSENPKLRGKDAETVPPGP